MSTNDNNVLASVVTVCYNAEKELPMTMESVLSQDFSDYEYIVQDGGSRDSSLSIIESYRDRFRAKGISFKVITGPDEGIYDAMNKAVTSCSGKWINFMNAGDCFYNSRVLSDVFSGKSYPTAAVLYGDCVEYEYGRFYLFPKNAAGIRKAMPFSHQSIFAHRELLLRLPFKCEYKYSADYDFLLSIDDRGLHFVDTGVVICITNKDGVSSVNYHDMLSESASIKVSHGITPPTEAESARTEKILTLKQFVLDHFPLFIKKAIRGIQIKSRGQSFNCQVPPWYKL